MIAVGYREACAVARGAADPSGLAERIARSTWRYAKRQRTWLRRERDVTNVQVTTPTEARAEIARLAGW